MSLRKIKGHGIKKSKPTQDFIRLSAILNKENFIKCREYFTFSQYYHLINVFKF